MANPLEQIVNHKRSELAASRAARSVEALRAMPGFALRPRNFFGAVAVPRPRPNLIAELKASSPSAGVLRPAAAFDPVATARTFERGGAAALSVLTDERFFGGRLEFIPAIKDRVSLPVLRKDFLLDPYQIEESRAFQADAVLLIGELLDTPLLGEMVDAARGLDLAVLLEVHRRETLLRVLETLDLRRGASVLLGINNRDLETQRVDLETTETLAPLVPPGMPLVSESGIRSRADVERVSRCGARAVLVGETLMRSRNPVAAIHELLRP